MSTNSLLTPARCGTFTLLHSLGNVNELLTHTLQQGALLSRYSIGLGNENKLRTHTRQGAVHFFPAQFAIKNPSE